MLKILKVLTALLCLVSVSCAASSSSLKIDLRQKYTNQDFLKLKDLLRTGDIVFQYTKSGVSSITESITSSPITHVGIIIVEDNKVSVFEASNKVKFTKLKKFLLKSKNGWLAVKRPAEELSIQQRKLLKENTKQWLNKPYDIKFSWSDEKIYCTELIYKMYENIGVKISDLQRISDIIEDNEDNTILNSYIKKVYGKRKNVKQNEFILTPVLLFYSQKLKHLTDENGQPYDTFPYHINDGGP